MPRPRSLRGGVARGTLLAPLVLLAVVTGCSSGPPALVGTAHSLVYCHDGGIPETLNVYEPAAPKASAPTVVQIHGGGWVAGDATLVPGTVDWDVESALVNKGWIYVAINYRLAPASPWPAQVQDAKCAMRYLRANAPVLHIDPNRIGVMGSSAGGHLAAMLGLTPDQTMFDTGEWSTASSAVQAVVDEYGPTDLTSKDWSHSPFVAQIAKETFGVPAGQDAPALAAASPVTYVRPGAPPFLVIQGAADTVVPPSQSKELVRDLHAAGDVATLIMVRNGEHGLNPTIGVPISPSTTALAAYTVRFLTQQLDRSGAVPTAGTS